MKITSTDSLLLDELYNELQRKHIEVEKESREIDGSMAAGTTVALIVVGATLFLKSIDTIINILNYFEKNKLLENKHLAEKNNFYIHIKLKDGREMSLMDLTKEKQRQESKSIKDNLEILFIDMGQKK